MDKLRAAVAGATERAARSRPAMWLRSTATIAPGDTEAQRGQGLAEYALILALIAILAIVSLVFLGGSIVGQLEEIINEGFRYVQEIIGG
jgi:Flp pilus assembly pilin Flp